MFAFKDITVKVKDENETTGSYEISPLPKGYGNTLANAMRRILLSSLEGAAVTSVKINGISHEYSTIEGVKEDVIEIILNIKSLRFKSLSDEPQVCKLEASGQKTLMASDITGSSNVEVLTKDVEIAHLTDESSSVSIEIVVEKGVGYKEIVDTDRNELGRIPLDAAFSPVKNVSIDVVRARKGQETDLDGVNINITTDGSIAPKDALLQSVKILQDFAGKVMFALGISKKEVDEMAELAQKGDQEQEESEADEVNSWKVEDLPISKRSKSGLLYGGFQSVGDISKASISQLMALPGFGAKSLNEVVELMRQYGIQIKQD